MLPGGGAPGWCCPAGCAGVVLPGGGAPGWCCPAGGLPGSWQGLPGVPGPAGGWPGAGAEVRRCGGPRGPGGPGNAGVSKGRNRQSRSPGQLMPGQLLPGQRRLGRLVPEFGRLLQVPRLLRWSRCSSAVAPLWSVTTQTRQILVRTRDLRYTARTHVHSDATEENDGLSGVWMDILGQDRRPLVASGAALALANATAYSSIVIDPVVIAFAFLVWLPRVSARHTGYWAVWFGAVWLAFFSLLMTVSGSWAGLAFTVLNRKLNDYEMPIVILGDIARSAGFIIVIALIGVAVAIRTEERSRRGLLVLVGAAALFVPAAQLHFQTSWALDKHLAFGVWFASMAAG